MQERLTKLKTKYNLILPTTAANAIKDKNPKSAVVIGGGFVGIEMAENLKETGIEVTLIEAADQIMGPLDLEMARILEKHLVDEGKELILRNLYVDDLTASWKDISEAKVAISQVVNILSQADFHIHSWATNEPRLTKEIGIDMKTKGEVKVLGLFWNVETDMLHHSKLENMEIKFTKRSLLAALAEIFSPLGLAAPLIVSAKIKIKALHIYGFDWDDDLQGFIKAHEGKANSLQDDINFWKKWLEFRSILHMIDFERCLIPSNSVKTEIHIFCDASEEAFGAVAYLRSIDQDKNISLRLIMAKTKVAPKKVISVAKLELNAALLGARLANRLKSILKSNVTRYFWTDSSCTRHWVRSTATFFKAYVANRIGEIQTLTMPDEWRFCPGKLNPADILTRSILPESNDELLKLFECWKRGPEFLYCDDGWPKDIKFAGPPKEEMRPKYEFITFSIAANDDRVIAKNKHHVVNQHEKNLRMWGDYSKIHHGAISVFT